MLKVQQNSDSNPHPNTGYTGNQYRHDKFALRAETQGPHGMWKTGVSHHSHGVTWSLLQGM